MSTIRFKIGVNAWECKCGAIVATGRVCSCGARQINNVVEKKHAQNRSRRQARTPAATGKFTESYLFRGQNNSGDENNE